MLPSMGATVLQQGVVTLVKILGNLLPHVQNIVAHALLAHALDKESPEDIRVS